MKVATQDRGEIIHFAGRHRLSPALREGAPVFTSGNDHNAVRCGWEPLFRAVEARKLALVYDPDDPTSAALERPPRDARRAHRSLGAALEHSARFVRALLPHRAHAQGEPDRTA